MGLQCQEKPSDQEEFEPAHKYYKARQDGDCTLNNEPQQLLDTVEDAQSPGADDLDRPHLSIAPTGRGKMKTQTEETKNLRERKLISRNSQLDNQPARYGS